MGRGVWLAVDVGKVRVGVARCDPAGILAVPVATLGRDEDGGDVAEVAALVGEHGARGVVVGLPVLMSGKAGSAARDALGWAHALARRIGPGVDVRLLDERLTSVTAHSQLLQAGRARRSHKKVVDQQAAVVILEQALRIMHGSGSLPGCDLAAYPTQEEPAGE